RQVELARIEESASRPTTFAQIGTSTPSSIAKSAANPKLTASGNLPATGAPPSKTSEVRLNTTADSAKAADQASAAEVAAEKLASQLPAQKPAPTKDGQTRQVVISIADRKLALIEEGRTVKTYAIAVGARYTPSPDGDFTVINHAKDPTYRHKGKEILPGKENPLGTRWIGLSQKGYGIHGTNVPSSIGKAASHGCFRMGKQDVEDLYSRVQVGDTVTVRRERDAMIARVFPDENQNAAGGEVQVAAANSSAAGVNATATQVQQ
ncbi:MAG TPA: L,D-transpeptidase, partial [Candidatus Limnocylindrales bacterium]|nr:L,D-transpeptidase [Candidatus Limnocylindrales bacterium]